MEEMKWIKVVEGCSCPQLNVPVLVVFECHLNESESKDTVTTFVTLGMLMLDKHNCKYWEVADTIDGYIDPWHTFFFITNDVHADKVLAWMPLPQAANFNLGTTVLED